MHRRRESHGITPSEHADRRHSAETTGPVPASSDADVPHEQDTEQDRIARAAGAIGPDTVTDPLELMSRDDRFDRGRTR